MMIEERIINKINQRFNPQIFFLENESHQHLGQQTESHFKIYLVSEEFKGLSKIDRQRFVNDLMREEFSLGLHALSLRLRTEEEHSVRGVRNFISPVCASKNLK